MTNSKLRICFSVPIRLCRRDLKLNRLPTLAEYFKWCNANVPALFLEPVTREQASYMLDHPDEVAS